ncbi:MAG: aldose epimerase family protein, partial [Oscillospiraceae bacterium]
MSIEKRPFGKTMQGGSVDCFTLTNGRGMSAEILTYGGILRALSVPVGDTVRDVVLGFDRLADYEAQDKYLGAIVGRVANRIGGAGFTLDGTDYALAANSAPNCLHGGLCGFDRKVWHPAAGEEGLTLTCTSPAGEEGFPGALRVTVTYVLTEDNALTIAYLATTDAPTLVNLTNHSYFNLAGGGTIDTHRVQIFAAAITENDATSVPTGRLLPVEGTPFDLRQPRVLGESYDHNFVLSAHRPGGLAASLWADGLRMDCTTTQPGLQLYTANYLAGERGKGGAIYAPRTAVCLETQGFPDAIHHPNFPTVVLRPGETYRETTTYRFS